MKKLMLTLIMAGIVVGLSLAYVDLSSPSNLQSPPPVADQGSSEIRLSYQTGDCSQERFRSSNTSSVSDLDYEIAGNRLIVNQQLNYVCCADIRLSKKLVNNKIKVYETNQGGMCKCLCTYPIKFNITGLTPASYTLQVYGIGYEDYGHNYSLLNEIDLRID